ncbi:Transient receptor potential cation channel subfamily M member [Dirofilaria immitis]
MISEDEMMNVEIAYRHAHACYIPSNFCLSNEDERCRLLEEEKLEKFKTELKNIQDIQNCIKKYLDFRLDQISTLPDSMLLTVENTTGNRRKT